MRRLLPRTVSTVSGSNAGHGPTGPCASAATCGRATVRADIRKEQLMTLETRRRTCRPQHEDGTRSRSAERDRHPRECVPPRWAEPGSFAPDHDPPGRCDPMETSGHETGHGSAGNGAHERKAGVNRRVARRVPKMRVSPLGPRRRLASRILRVRMERRIGDRLRASTSDGRQDTFGFVQADHETNTSGLSRSLVCFLPGPVRTASARPLVLARAPCAPVVEQSVATVTRSSILCNSPVPAHVVRNEWAIGAVG